MATTPTQLPVPSEKLQDLKFNAGKIDEFVTSSEDRYTDRLGGEHYTIEGLNNLAKQAIASFGYITFDSFQDGATLTLPNQALRDTSSGNYYRWDGPLPKVVPPGSTPENSGGTGNGAWLLISTRGYDVVTTSTISAGVFGVDTAVIVSDRENALFKIVSGGVANGMDILDAGNGRTAVLIIDSSTTIKSIGAKQNNIDVDETAYVQRWIEICDGVIDFGNCTVGHLDFKGRSTLSIRLIGDLIIAPTESLVVWGLASSDQPTKVVSIDLNGFAIDCNHLNQPVRNELLITNYVTRMHGKNGIIKNMKKGSIGGTLSSYELLEVCDMDFTEGSLHTNVMNESCRFIGVFGGKKTSIRRCKFKQLSAPIGNQVRNPCGVFISGSNGDKDIEVEDCEFDNLGNLILENLDSPLDVYSHARSVSFARNKFTRSRYVAFRATNVEQANIYDNEVVQDSPHHL